ncbi:hypothetical protein Pan97_50420 [Bremerella volcania]|uniref:DUF4259 domain-containing protein n=1 Tax=Bremerella volcania TaxID=2527984 RepID=A0A518CFF5_9BACT|nr:DUF4259 domain-containing protein [Bremerella volcania]QDU77963.1 hypothetical protein Pan97_50420 [Bremerella volcania]
MGAWGYEIFDNDTACDWLDSLTVCDDLSWIETTLETSINAEDHLDVDQASEALAACEAIAHLRGRPGLHEASLDQLNRWVDRHKHLNTDHLVPLATQALARITSDDCQLKQQWQQTDQFEQWVATVEDVGRRIV